MGGCSGGFIFIFILRLSYFTAHTRFIPRLTLYIPPLLLALSICKDEATGKIYYHNTKTGEVSWIKPDSEEEDHSNSDHRAWLEVVDPDSKQVYYFHAKTGETRWEKPAPACASASSAGPAATGGNAECPVSG